MNCHLTLLFVFCVTICLGEESIPSKITLPQVPDLKTRTSKTSESSSLLSKSSTTNTSLGSLLGSKVSQVDAKGSVAKASEPSSSTDTKTSVAAERVPCTCGIFLSGQLLPGSKEPQGFPPLLQEYDQPFPCTPLGHRQCANKCLEVIARHLRNSATIICGSLDRDCFKERAFLWTKNCNDVWENSHMSAGREYCCKDGVPYKCPLGKT